MRRLLSLLRSSQTYCTDNECLQDGLPGPGQTDGTSDNFMMMMIGWMLMAAVMFFLRPNSMRNNSTEGKPSGEISHKNIKNENFFQKHFFRQVRAQAGTPRDPEILLQALVKSSNSLLWYRWPLLPWQPSLCTKHVSQWLLLDLAKFCEWLRVYVFTSYICKGSVHLIFLKSPKKGKKKVKKGPK